MSGPTWRGAFSFAARNNAMRRRRSRPCPWCAWRWVVATWQRINCKWQVHVSNFSHFLMDRASGSESYLEREGVPCGVKSELRRAAVALLAVCGSS